jgi:nitrate reductase NapE component
MGVALAIGLLIGAERERAKPSGGSPGVRTFALIAVMGVVAVQLPPVVAAALVGGTVLLVVVGYAWSTAKDPGMTSEAAAIATLGLGALTATEPALAVGLAVSITVLLVSRESLHRFVRETVTDRERVDALKFFVAAFVVLPLLPTGHVGPYGVWVPQQIWLLVVLIIGIGWIGYVATRRRLCAEPWQAQCWRASEPWCSSPWSSRSLSRGCRSNCFPRWSWAQW